MMRLEFYLQWRTYRRQVATISRILDKILIEKRNDYTTKKRRFIYKKQSANNWPGRSEIRTGRAGPTL